MMIFYNQRTHNLQLMLDLGSSCVYLAIIATIAGVGEAFIKISEIVCQNVSENQNNKKVNA